MNYNPDKIKPLIAKAIADNSFQEIRKFCKRYFYNSVEENGKEIKRIVLYDGNKKYVGKINVVKRLNSEYEVEGFYIVVKKYRGIGLGYYLLRSMIALIQQNDAEAKTLFVKPNSGEIQPFLLYKKYHRQGFVFDDELEQRFMEIEKKTSEDHGIFDKRRIRMEIKL